MANPNFTPTFSSDEIWREQDTNVWEPSVYGWVEVA